MISQENLERIRQSAAQTIRVLEMPIAGEPSIIVVNRENAMRLMVSALGTLWEASEGQ